MDKHFGFTNDIDQADCEKKLTNASFKESQHSNLNWFCTNIYEKLIP